MSTAKKTKTAKATKGLDPSVGKFDPKTATLTRTETPTETEKAPETPKAEKPEKVRKLGNEETTRKLLLEGKTRDELVAHFTAHYAKVGSRTDEINGAFVTRRVKWFLWQCSRRWPETHKALAALREPETKPVELEAPAKPAKGKGKKKA